MGDLALEFCGEWFDPAQAKDGFDIGREGDLAIDDNPYLHRRFLRVTQEDGIWWLSNVGSLISATVCDAGGGVQSWLPPGHRLPLVFPTTSIVFTAGPTTYEVTAQLTDAPYHEVRSEDPDSGATTIGAISFTTSQKQLIVVLAEPMLRREGTGLSEIPSSADAARRLAGPRPGSTASSTTSARSSTGSASRGCAAGPASSPPTGARGSSSTRSPRAW